MLSVIISVLNWLLLGFPKKPPPEARAGAPITEEQCAVQDRLLKLIVRFLRASAFDSETLGRRSEKFDRVAKFIQELPAEGSEVDLASLLHDLRRSFDPYARPEDNPKPRAKRNTIGTRFEAGELAHLTAYNPAEHWGKCYLSLSSLAMGDSLAVELAQQAHVGVLRSLRGSLLPSQTVAYRRAFPRGAFAEFLCIDDHISAQVVNRKAAIRAVPLRDTAVFARAGAACEAVRLVQHPKKKRRGVLSSCASRQPLRPLCGVSLLPRRFCRVLLQCASAPAKFDV